MMKIFFPISTFFPSQSGGPSNALYWHTSELYKCGIDIRIITTDIGIKKDLVVKNVQLENECGNIIYYQTPLSFKPFIQIFKNLRWADIIHLNSIFSIYSIFSFFCIKLFFPKKKVIWSVRGELNSRALAFSTLKKKLVLFFYSLLSNKVVFHSTSNDETLDIRNIFPKNQIFQIPNFIRPSKRNSVEIKKEILYMGRIHPIKAIENLIQALSLSSTFIDEDFKLLIVGQAEDRHKDYEKELHKLCSELGLQDRIVFKGYVSGQDKELIYSEAYVLVLPSKSENFGNVVVESLNQGTPVIASLGTPWSILEEYHCGIHCSNDPLELAKAIDNVLNLEKEEYSLWRNNSTRLVDDNFNVSSQIYQWVELYKKRYEN